MQADAVGLRDQQGKSTATKLHKAADEGIPPDSFWSKVGHAVSAAWHVIVEIAKIVVAIGGIIALIIGGPLAWIVFAAALIVLVDTLTKYAQGKASLLDVGLALLSCIPCTKGLTSLSELSAAFKSGGLLGAGAHLLGSTKNAAIGFLRTAQRLRVGGLAGAKAVFTSFSDAKNAFAGARGFDRFTAAFGKVAGARSVAVTQEWNAYVARIGESDPAQAARLWQGHGSYPGVDTWHNETLPAGYKMEAGAPGFGGYTVPDGTMGAVGNDSAAYHQGVQVGPTELHGGGYRSTGIRFETAAPTDVASSTAHANPQYGPGGSAQHYVPDFADKVASGQIRAVDDAGNQLTAEVNGSNVSFKTDSGQVIHLSNSSLPNDVPTLQHIAATRPVMHQSVPRIIAEPWSIDNARSGR